ncbi:MAG: glycosyltransferase family 2 protein [Bacteroidia bacterium]
MKISIITITYNSAETLEETIRSVVSQDYPNIEYIIIDGLSKDATLQIAEKYKGNISKLISEKDNGLYDALNKGIQQCTGDVIGMLHSDDVYYDEHVLSKVAAAFAQHPDAGALYGDLIFVERFDLTNIKRVWRSGKYKEGAFAKGWMPPHPTFFVRRHVYEKHGLFNTDLRLAADYELMLRFIHVKKVKLIYLPIMIIRMRMGGVSNFSLALKWKAHLEDRKAWALNGMRPTLSLLRKPLSKVFQYFQRSE